jgi:predicted metalloprotease with PDZ domain
MREAQGLREQLGVSQRHRQADRSEIARMKTHFNGTVGAVEEEVRRLQGELADVRGDAGRRAAVVEKAKEQFAAMRPTLGLEFQSAAAAGGVSGGGGSADVFGVVVVDVVDGKPAGAAGLRRGDVVEQVNGHDTGDGDAFKAQLKFFRPGDQVPFQIDRSGQILTLVVEIGCTTHTREQVLRTRRLASGLVHDADFMIEDEYDAGAHGDEIVLHL